MTAFEAIDPSTTLAVMFGPIGSATYTDGGRDALVFEQTTGIPTLAVDRPGAGLILPGGQLAVGEINTYSNLVADAIEQTASQQGIMSAEVRRIITIGRSAGGLAAAAAAVNGEVLGAPITHVFAGEPVSTYATTLEDGWETWKAYRKRESEKISDITNYPGLVRPDKTDTHGLDRLVRLGAMLPNFLNDKHYNARLWAAGCLPDILGSIPAGVLVMVDFASDSMILPQDALQQSRVLESITAQLASRNDGSSVDVVPNTVHRSFDKRSFLAERFMTRAGYKQLPD